MDLMINVAKSETRWSEMVATALCENLNRRLAQQDMVSLVLTGGRTPRRVYERLAMHDLQAALDWNRVKIFVGDERTVRPDHPDSNYGMANEAWLRSGAVPKANIFRMEAEDPDPDAAAQRYERVIREHVPTGAAGLPVFDLVLLGLGTDGHIASLFPGTQALEENQRLVVATDVPELKTQRLTMTYPAFNAAAEVWFLAIGQRKAESVACVLGERSGGQLLPATRVGPSNGKQAWWLDESAAQMISRHEVRFR